jgi:hypothetical protein
VASRHRVFFCVCVFFLNLRSAKLASVALNADGIGEGHDWMSTSLFCSSDKFLCTLANTIKHHIILTGGSRRVKLDI